ncbi:MAG: glycosyltransferase [Bacteroidia bacterium]
MLVSIIIPTYKRLGYLQEALESVARQTYTEFECLVVNDFPPMRAEIDALVAGVGDARIRVIHHEKNGGESQSRNTALKEVQGEIVALLDDDDVWFDTYLEAVVRCHREHPQAGLVYAGYIQFWDNKVLGAKVYPAQQPPADLRKALLQGRFVLASSSIVSLKKEAFDRCGNFDTGLPSFADWDMWLRISEFYGWAAITEPLVYYRHHLGDRGSTNIEKRMIGIQHISKKWSKYPDFEVYRRTMRVSAYFNEIRTLVLQKNYSKGWQLLFDCIRTCKGEVLTNFSLFAFALGLLLMGPLYPRFQKRKNEAPELVGSLADSRKPVQAHI